MQKRTRCKNCWENCFWYQDSDGKWHLLDPETVYYDNAKQGQRLLSLAGKVVTVNKAVSLPELRGRILHYTSCRSNQNKTKKLKGQNELHN